MDPAWWAVHLELTLVAPWRSVMLQGEGGAALWPGAEHCHRTVTTTPWDDTPGVGDHAGGHSSHGHVQIVSLQGHCLQVNEAPCI